MVKSAIFETFLAKAGSVPGIQIDRDKYLKQTFEREHRNELRDIILKGPIAAGISPQEVSWIADQAIKSEATQTTIISAGTGVFGGVAALAAIPADIAQFYGHLFRVVQKLMYLYGWEEDIFDEDGIMDDTTENVLIIYFGLMFGVGAASQLAAQIAKEAAKKVLRDVPVRVVKAFFTKQAFREVIKKIVKAIGVKTALKVSVSAGTKIVPLVGAVTSGALTAVFFIPMSKKLKKYLAKGEIDKSIDDD